MQRISLDIEKSYSKGRYEYNGFVPRGTKYIIVGTNRINWPTAKATSSRIDDLEEKNALTMDERLRSIEKDQPKLTLHERKEVIKSERMELTKSKEVIQITVLLSADGKNYVQRAKVGSHGGVTYDKLGNPHPDVKVTISLTTDHTLPGIVSMKQHNGVHVKIIQDVLEDLNALPFLDYV